MKQQEKNPVLQERKIQPFDPLLYELEFAGKVGFFKEIAGGIVKQGHVEQINEIMQQVRGTAVTHDHQDDSETFQYRELFITHV